jgi:mannosyltransferase OCH1-like enzyme
MSVKIPKIIAQTWETNDVPEMWKSGPEAIKKYHPTWEYVLFTNDDRRKFVEKHFPGFLEIYNSYDKGVQRADLFRIMWMYVKGGLYMDLDHEPIKPLDPLFYYDMELYLVQGAEYYVNGFLASKPGCKYWLLCLEVIKERHNNVPWYIMGDFVVLYSTGPLVLKEAMKRYEKPYASIPRKMIYPCNVCDKEYNSVVCDERAQYVKNIPGSSWISSQSNMLLYLKCYFDYGIGI